MTDLLPCPFCGSPPARRDGDGNTTHPYSAIHCSNDECIGPKTTAAFFDDAAFQWNKRASIPDVAQPAVDNHYEDIEAAARAIFQVLSPGVQYTPQDSIWYRKAAEAAARCFAEVDDPVAQPPAAPVELTNHHNALKCPYCNPKGLQFAEPHEGCSAGNEEMVKLSWYGLVEKIEAHGVDRELAEKLGEIVRATVEKEKAAIHAAPQPTSKTRPAAFLAWAKNMFGDVAGQSEERLLRFVEEAIELAHADGMERAMLGAIICRIYDRPAGEITKEIGQAQACLEMYAENLGLSSSDLAEIEWRRVQKIPREEWQRRHAAKQKIGIALESSSPLSRPERASESASGASTHDQSRS